MTHKLYINAYFIIFGRPSRSSNLMPRLTVVGVVLPLSSRTAAASKQKYLDYDVFPPMESNHRKAVPGAGWVGVIIQAVYNMCIMLPVKNINP